MDFVGKIQVKGSDRFIGGFQSGSVICIEGLNPQARGLPLYNTYIRGKRSHVTGLMTDPA